jgi:hypothetical protein
MARCGDRAEMHEASDGEAAFWPRSRGGDDVDEDDEADGQPPRRRGRRWLRWWCGDGDDSASVRWREGGLVGRGRGREDEGSERG